MSTENEVIEKYILKYNTLGTSRKSDEKLSITRNPGLYGTFCDYICCLNGATGLFHQKRV